MPSKSSLTWALFLIRLGLGLYLALLAKDKIFNIDSSSTMIIGGLELVLALLFLLGAFRTYTYSLGLITQVISTLAYYEHADIPILFAFISLFLIRNLDTKFSLTKKRGIFL